MARYVTGTDIGGTFTDTFVMNEEGGIWRAKAATTPHRYSEGILNSMAAAAEQIGLSLADLLSQTVMFSNGTTVATNILAQLSGAKVGLITTRGFKDTLHMARSPREYELDFYKQVQLPEIVTRNCIEEVIERVDYKGMVIVPLRPDEVRAAVRRLVEDRKVDTIAVCLLWSFRHPEHEQQIKSIIKEMYPDLYVSISSDIYPVIREYERTITAVLNSYTGHGFNTYINSVEGDLREKGLQVPISVMQSSGGTFSSGEARTRPVSLLYSGPAAGVIGSQYLGRQLGYDNIITADMGGTSFDVSTIHEGEPLMTSRAIVYRFLTGVTMLDIHTIGAGGGSIGWIDGRGMLRVGPQSAGAVPGPVAYGAGGSQPTVTDAAVALGLIDPDYFLGGRMKLHKNLAEKAIEANLCDALNCSVTEAASGVYRTVSASMSNALRNITVEKGYDPRDFVLMSYGGCSPLFIAEMARELEIGTIIIPEVSSVLSAFGAAVADIRRDVSQTYHGHMPIAAEAINPIYAQLEKKVREEIRAEGVSDENIDIFYEADLRFIGQAWEISVRIPILPLNEASVQQLYEAFEQKYERLYGKETAYKEAGSEFLNCRVIGIGRTWKPELRRFPEGPRQAHPALMAFREIYSPYSGKILHASIYDGSKLQNGMIVEGPAIIERTDTTVFVVPNSTVRVDEYNNFILELL